MDTLSGKAAFITGGASGIGLGMAHAFVASGAKVAIADVDAGQLAQAAEALRAEGGTVLAMQLDVRDRKRWGEVADETEATLGPIDILCNNAGVTGYTSVADTVEENWDWIQAVNLTGPYNGVRAIGRRMRMRGQGGHIVNTASTAGLYGFINGTVSAYVASKFGLVGMSEALRREMAPHGIGVSILVPGLVTTNIGPNVMKLRPDPQPAVTLTPLQQELRARSRRYGMSPLKVGQRVVKGILANDMYIITHPEFREFVEARHTRMMADFGESADPDLPLNPDWRDSA
jgi:2-hydroxycyclohexanecarboxyl-CoA dehydrogenase